MGRTRFEDQYSWDDIHLANLINSAYEVPKPKPWWYMPSWFLGIGCAVLIVVAWWVQ